MPLCGFKGRQSPEHVGQSHILLHVDLDVVVVNIKGADASGTAMLKLCCWQMPADSTHFHIGDYTACD